MSDNVEDAVVFLTIACAMVMGIFGMLYWCGL